MKKNIFWLSLFMAISSFLMLSARAQESQKTKSSAITFELKMICTNNSEACQKAIVKDTVEEIYVRKDSFVDLKDVVSAESRINKTPKDIQDALEKAGVKAQLTSALIVKFNERGKEKLKEITSENVGKRVAIFIDGDLVLAPKIQEPILEGELATTFSSPEKIQDIAERINKAVSQVH